MTTADAFSLFLASRLARGLSPRTVAWYRQILTKLTDQFTELPTRPEQVELFLAKCPGGDECRHGYYEQTILSLSISQSAKIEMMKALQKLRSERTREPASPAPEGGIGIREAGRKYDVHYQTIQRWVNKGLVPVLAKTDNWTYINESVVKELAEKYHQSPGRGKREHLSA